MLNGRPGSHSTLNIEHSTFNIREGLGQSIKLTHPIESKKPYSPSFTATGPLCVDSDTARAPDPKSRRRGQRGPKSSSSPLSAYAFYAKRQVAPWQLTGELPSVSTCTPEP